MDIGYDDDTPPPLGSLPDQVHAVKLSTSIIGTTWLKDGDLRTASTTHAQQQPTTSAASKSLRKGFFDAPIRQNHNNPSGRVGGKQGSKQQDTMPVITAQGCKQPGVKQVPEFMRLEPTEEQKRLEAYKSQLVNALRPTPETVAAVNQDSTLMAGFEDPDIMAAVSEIARDPASFKKYVNNPKVVRFYQAMGSHMGHKLEAVAQQQQQQQRPPAENQRRWQQQQQRLQQNCPRPFLPR